MAYKNKLKLNEMLSDEESISEIEHITSVLSIVNGYCKVNLVVPQTSTFYTNENLLPINAKIDKYKLNNNTQKNLMSNTHDGISDILKNKIRHKSDLDDNSDQIEDNTGTISFKGKKKKNKHNIPEIGTASASGLNNQYSVPSKNICTDENTSTGYNNQHENDKLKNKLYNQETQKKQMKNEKNNINNAQMSRRSRRHQNSENNTQNDTNQSECPLCFQSYPTPDIEAHASECSI